MSVSIRRIELDGFDQLPAHTRRCVFWEVDPAVVSDTMNAAMRGSLGAFESEFDKEAWISGLLLEWGNCGQIAIQSPAAQVVGSAFYAPPNRVPRSRSFPTSPVSSDAVLLTAISTEPGHETEAVMLLDAVIADLIRRGVRAIEAFGIRDTGDVVTATEISTAAIEAELNHLCEQCIIPAEFLQDNGFEVVAAHHRFPRYRLDLNEGLGWKFEVESALEKLVATAAMELELREQLAPPLPAGAPAGTAIADSIDHSAVGRAMAAQGASDEDLDPAEAGAEPNGRLEPNGQ